MLEDVAKDLVSGDIAGNGREVVDALADVLTQEIARYAVLEALADAADALLRLDQKVIQLLQSVTVFGRYPHVRISGSGQGIGIIAFVVNLYQMLSF